MRFAPGELRGAFPGWAILMDEASEFDAPGGTVKRFETVIARRPGRVSPREGLTKR